MPVERPAQPAQYIWWRDFAIATVIALAFTLPLIAHQGLPGYLHDWSWPPDAESMRFYVQRAWSSWSSDGLGGPNFFPSALPHFVVLWLLAPLVPTKVLLVLSLIVAWAVGIFSIALIVRTLASAPQWITLAVGTLYMAAPLVLTKTVAGHIAYVEAYAAFAAFAASLFSIRNSAHPWRWVARAALAGAFTLLQLQFIGFDALLLLALTAATVVPVRHAIVVAVFMVAASLPALAGPIFIAGDGSGTIAMQRAVLSWQQIQSVQPLPALEGRGYFTYYFENVAPHQALWAHVLLIAPIAAAIGAIVSRHRRAAAALVAIGIVSWLACTSLKGPAAPLFRDLFLRFNDMSLYREVYDTLAPYVLAVAVLAGVAFSRLWRPLSAVALAVLLLTLSVAWARWPKLVGTESAQLLAQLPKTMSGHGRVVWWPAAQPIGPLGDGPGGVDPLAFTPLGTLTPLFEYEPYGLFASAVYDQTHGNGIAAAREFCTLGVQKIIERPHLVSYVSGRASRPQPLVHSGSLRLLSQGADFRQFGIAGACGVFGFQHGDGNLASLGTALPRSLMHDAPTSGELVAAFPYYWRYAPIGSCGEGAVLAEASSLERLPYDWLFAGRADTSRPCSWIPKRRLARGKPRTLFVAGAGSGVRPDLAVHRTTAASGRVSIDRWGLDYVSGEYDARDDARLLFRTTFDPRWTLAVDGRTTASTIANDFSNSWPVSRGRHRFTLEFSPRRPTQGMLLLASFALFLLIVASLPLRWSRRKRRHEKA
jgi:hypothetical protein